MWGLPDTRSQQSVGIQDLTETLSDALHTEEEHLVYQGTRNSKEIISLGHTEIYSWESRLKTWKAEEPKEKRHQLNFSKGRKKAFWGKWPLAGSKFFSDILMNFRILEA